MMPGHYGQTATTTKKKMSKAQANQKIKKAMAAKMATKSKKKSDENKFA